MCKKIFEIQNMWHWHVKTLDSGRETFVNRIHSNADSSYINHSYYLGLMSETDKIQRERERIQKEKEILLKCQQKQEKVKIGLNLPTPVPLRSSAGASSTSKGRDTRLDESPHIFGYLA